MQNSEDFFTSICQGPNAYIEHVFIFATLVRAGKRAQDPFSAYPTGLRSQFREASGQIEDTETEPPNMQLTFHAERKNCHWLQATIQEQFGVVYFGEIGYISGLSMFSDGYRFFALSLHSRTTWQRRREAPTRRSERVVYRASFRMPS